MKLADKLLDTIVGDVSGLLDELITTEEERAAARLRLVELHKEGQLAQIGLNAQEAQHNSLFVAGWRPLIGWTCGAAFVWAFLASPMLATLAFYWTSATGEAIDLAGLPELDLGTMMPVLLGMLGLGGYRTLEKIQGVARQS